MDHHHHRTEKHKSHVKRVMLIAKLQKNCDKKDAPNFLKILAKQRIYSQTKKTRMNEKRFYFNWNLCKMPTDHTKAH